MEKKIALIIYIKTSIILIYMHNQSSRGCQNDQFNIIEPINMIGRALGLMSIDNTPPSKNLDTKKIPCKFGTECKRDDCNYYHEKPKTLFKGIPCKFGDKCQRPDCHFLHEKPLVGLTPTSSAKGFP